MATADIAQLCVISQQKNANGRLKRNEYKRIHDDVLIRHKLNELDPHYSVSKSSIDSRIRRKSLVVNEYNNQQSPIAEVEPVLLQIVLWKQAACQPITPTEGLELANLLIDNKPLQQKLRDLQISIRKSPSGILSRKYWTQFMKRHNTYLQ